MNYELYSITNYELRITNYEYKLRITNFIQLRIKNYEYKLRITNYDYRGEPLRSPFEINH